MDTPCTQHPHRFLQPGEADTWLGATWAANACQTHCHRRTECAREALTAGTLLSADPETHPLVASGVIQAGIHCRGDVATHQALTLIAYPDAAAPAAVTSACAICGRPFHTADTATCRTAGNDEVHRASLNSPFCRGCYSTARWQGRLQPLRRAVPDHCRTCSRPMTARTDPREGHVRHEAAGRCGACCRREQRGKAA